MALIDRIGAQVARQRFCVRAYPCSRCEGEPDAFEGAGCRIIATAALAAMLPDALNHRDDHLRAVKIAEDRIDLTDDMAVIEIVRDWIVEALTE